jgi:hypothetical protein
MTRSTGITTRLLARRSIPSVAELEALLLTDELEAVILLQSVAERGEPRVQQLALLARDADRLRTLAVAALERLTDLPTATPNEAGGFVLACEQLSDGEELRALWVNGEGSSYFALVAGCPEQGRCMIVDGLYGAELAKLLCKGAAVVASPANGSLH